MATIDHFHADSHMLRPPGKRTYSDQLAHIEFELSRECQKRVKYRRLPIELPGKSDPNTT